MNKLFCLLFISFNWIVPLKAQSNFGNEWFLGLSCSILRFNTNIPTSQIMGQFPLDTLLIVYGNSNICDSNGRLILATDGIKLYDSNGKYLDGGGEQINNYKYPFAYGNDNPVRSSSIILPFSNQRYRIFNATMSDDKFESFQTNFDTFDFNQLRVTTVDMKANNGKGIITTKNELIYEAVTYPWLNKACMTACRHGNGRDWWLLKPSARLRQTMHRWLVTDEAIVHDEQTLPQYFNQWCYDNVGQSAFSQDGSLYAECNTHSPHGIYYFDRCTGELTLKRVFDVKPYKDTFGGFDNNNDKWRGLCFSPNNRFLYTCDAYNVYQIDLDNPIDSLAIRRVSKDTTIWAVSDFGFPQYSCMQLTPTGVIYIGNWHGVSPRINGIMKPNELGDNCEFKFNYFENILIDSLEGIGNTNSPPNMPFYGLGALKGSPCDSLSPKIVVENPVIVPSAFSPNGDGLNEVWHILNQDALLATDVFFQSVGIYNRWGNEVFKSTALNFAWDAKGLASGSYYFYIQYKSGGVTKVQKGSVNVVR